MGILDRLLGAVAGSLDSRSAEDQGPCAFCGADVNEPSDYSPDFGCSECAEGGTAYCCGNIYEDGETVCTSCGDPL